MPPVGHHQMMVKPSNSGSGIIFFPVFPSGFDVYIYIACLEGFTSPLRKETNHGNPPVSVTFIVKLTLVSICCKSSVVRNRGAKVLKHINW